MASMLYKIKNILHDLNQSVFSQVPDRHFNLAFCTCESEIFCEKNHRYPNRILESDLEEVLGLLNQLKKGFDESTEGERWGYNREQVKKNLNHAAFLLGQLLGGFRVIAQFAHSDSSVTRLDRWIERNITPSTSAAAYSLNYWVSQGFDFVGDIRAHVRTGDNFCLMTLMLMGGIFLLFMSPDRFLDETCPKIISTCGKFFKSSPWAIDLYLITSILIPIMISRKFDANSPLESDYNVPSLRFFQPRFQGVGRRLCHEPSGSYPRPQYERGTQLSVPAPLVR